MFCNHCGKIISDNAAFCNWCGGTVTDVTGVIPTPQRQQAQTTPTQPAQPVQPIQPVQSVGYASSIPQQVPNNTQGSSEPIPPTELVERSAQPVSVPADKVISPSSSVVQSVFVPLGQGQEVPAAVQSAPGATSVPGVPNAPVYDEQGRRYYTGKHIALCLISTAIMAIAAGVFAGLYFFS